MDDTLRRKILDAEGLLSRATTEGEAEAASRALTRLLTRAGMSLEDVKTQVASGYGFIEHEVGDEAWERWLWDFCGRIRFCRGLFDRKSTRGWMVGLQADVEGAIRDYQRYRQVVVNLTTHRYRKLQPWEKPQNRKAWRRSYRLGVVLGVKKAAEEARDEEIRALETGMALVLVRDAALDAQMQQHFPDFKQYAIGNRQKNLDALHLGFEDGQALDRAIG
jgi:hypothetical protein